MMTLFLNFIYIYHHHHIALVARISLTLSRHSSLSFIALGRSSGQHPVSSHSCWMYVLAGRPAFARPCVGIHKSTSLIYIYIYIYIYIKLKNKVIIKWWIYYKGKSMLKHFSFNKPSSELKNGETSVDRTTIHHCPINTCITILVLIKVH